MKRSLSTPLLSEAIRNWRHPKPEKGEIQPSQQPPLLYKLDPNASSPPPHPAPFLNQSNAPSILPRMKNDVLSCSTAHLSKSNKLAIIHPHSLIMRNNPILPVLYLYRADKE
eukprot:CAMPEP_0194218788 /NCGR_PEP_ID=MMETSP0156-20130528/24525_1 /TAXON_ID=33649 /ORGANISM="Thalassionema nitzschioides, Strain L26-B" /LENGTH=111 /DNA_ID=CAMNT_0038948257 /DNA_START=408 /DNA_END=743 /DNA_ORIENTATION=+